jgi:hypothetical protein
MQVLSLPHIIVIAFERSCCWCKLLLYDASKPTNIHFDSFQNPNLVKIEDYLVVFHEPLFRGATIGTECLDKELLSRLTLGLFVQSGDYPGLLSAVFSVLPVSETVDYMSN